MIFKVEFNDPTAGWMLVGAGRFEDIHEALRYAEGVYDMSLVRVRQGTLEDLADSMTLAQQCLLCKNPLGYERGLLVCCSCGTEHTYESGEIYVRKTES